MSETPVRAVFGLPAYNHAHRLPEALESLLMQTYPGLRIIISDDGSTDETPEIIAEYAKDDPRLIYTRTPERMGYIGNARRCYELAREMFPEAEFFAWASDHDIWHPAWLERSIEVFDNNPGTVAVCPRSFRMDADGTIAKSLEVDLNTVGVEPVMRRFRKTFRGISAGNMVYGLFRADALKKAGIMRWQLIPDRLLLCELALYGSMAEVKEHLWFRRYRRIASIERQRAASFFDNVPAYVKRPWWMSHGVLLWKEYGSGKKADSPLTAGQGKRLAISYALMGIWLDVSRWYMRRERRLIRPVVKVVKRGWRKVTGFITSLPGRPHRALRPIYARFGARQAKD